jgi:hypothetical protein
MRKHEFSPNHTLFLKQNRGKTMALIIYIDYMIVTSNDKEGILELQKYLTDEFKMKDFGGLKYIDQQSIFLS